MNMKYQKESKIKKYLRLSAPQKNKQTQGTYTIQKIKSNLLLSNIQEDKENIK